MLNSRLASTLSVFRTRAALQLEILALRHQLGALPRSVKRPKLNRFDRVHGELLTLGIDIGETSVSKYVVRGKR
jgi:hypothetical protein